MENEPIFIDNELVKPQLSSNKLINFFTNKYIIFMSN